NAVPFVAVSAAHPVQVRPRTLGTPLERTVVNELTRDRIGTVTQGFSLKRTDHLRVAVVATFADIHIPTSQLQRTVRLETLDRLGGGLLEEQRNNFHQSPHSYHKRDQHDHEEVVGLDPGMTRE